MIEFLTCEIRKDLKEIIVNIGKGMMRWELVCTAIER